MNPEVVKDFDVGPLLDANSPTRRFYEELAEKLLSLERVRSVVVTAVEHGVGRTSVCLGLAAALAGMGHRAAVVDCNLRRPHLHRVLGEPNFVGLTSGLETGRALENYGREILPGLRAVPTGPVPSDPASYLGSERLVEAVRGLEEGRRAILLDSPVADRVLASRALSEGFDGILLVVHGVRTSKSIARETTDNLLEAGTNLLGVVLNGCARG
ncbi:MAG: CpsD/CapB family tyrosine-protein kinase [Rubrobacteraceae bacterium]